MFKKILQTGAAIFLLWQSYELLMHLHEITTQNPLLLLFIAWVINLFITGIFAFSSFAYPTYLLLPSRYYERINKERLEKFYDRLKVEWFRKVLLATLWKNKDQRKRYFNGKKTGLQQLDEQSRGAEFGHLVPFIVINMVGLYLFFIGMFLLAVFTVLINCIGNLYPIILQRHHRMRLQRLQSRWKKE